MEDKETNNYLRSSAEVEYRAMATVTSELIWIKSLLGSLGVFMKAPIPLHCDNQATIHITRNLVFYERTKHIEIDCHFVCEWLVSREIGTPYVSTEDQVADLFTKALGRYQFQHLLGKLCFKPSCSNLRGSIRILLGYCSVL